jgi:small-conductance mechanosensitive channel
MRRGFFAIVLSCLFLALSGAVAGAQTPAPPSEKVSALIKLLSDPEVKAWIESQQKQAPVTAAEPTPGVDLREVGTDLRGRFRALLAAVPQTPGAIDGVMKQVLKEANDTGLPPPGFIIVGIVVIALLGEWQSRRLFRTASATVSPVVAQAMGQIGPVLVFALISAVVFVSVDWPPAFDTVIVHYLVAAVVFRVVVALHVMALAAGSLTRHKYRRVLAFAAVLLFGLATIGIARSFEVDYDIQRVIAVVGSLILLAIAVEEVLNDPLNTTVRIRFFKILGLASLWLVWVLGFILVFWAMLYTVILPKLLPAVDRLTRAFAATRWSGDADTNLQTVLVVRGVRAVVIGVAVGWLLFVWQVNPRGLGSASTIFDSIFMGLLKSVIVILVADLGWAVAKAAISRKLATVAGGGEHDQGEEAARRARLRTLLPIFQNALAATLLVVTALMVLAELGVEIGPLVAGAGVLGVAIGFGSQTLVKDVISGVFYLMDDAFRVGEYIQSGSYMGTVESFSLRSVRLRHHRGPVFTVPFGELGAVQNMSRDWVIDKFRIKVGFNTDIAKAKKLTKAVGAELRQDEELGPLILETVKMKGVEQIGEYGIELSFAFTAKPGNQSMIRRRAYVMIRKAFAENGISFAQPTVNVGGEDKGDAAAAALHVQMQKAATEAQQAQQKPA